MYLLIRNHALKRQTHIPIIYRYYSTINVDTKKPFTAETVDGDAEIVILKRSSLKSKKTKKHRKIKQSNENKPSLSKRLKVLGLQRGWIQIPNFKHYEKVEPPSHVEVPTLAHGLEKVLFNPGVHYLKDPRTKFYNYSPYLENITQPVDFDYEAIQPYITSSKDNNLIDMAKSLNQRYIGSTSSISAVLSQFYFNMSNFKPVNLSCLSKSFQNQSAKFTRGARSAASIYLRWKDGAYAIDVAKLADRETVLSSMGKSMEKALTLEPADFERYLKTNSSQISEEERNQPESYAYGTFGKFLLRSQLDCYDDRLPRRTFDLKTRAAVPIRLDIQNYTDYLGYSLKHAQGLYESFEREYYDMMRAAFLKYSFQVRIGHMDGILVAYHNTRKIFGFQYISREEMDTRLFGSTKVGNRVFENSLFMFETVLDRATKKYPEQTLRLSFDTRMNNEKMPAYTNIFVEPVPENEENPQPNDNLEEFFQTDEDDSIYEPYPELSMYELRTKSFVNSQPMEGPLNAKKGDKWTINIQLTEVNQNRDDYKRLMFRAMRKRQAGLYKPQKRVNPNLKILKNMSDKDLRREQHEHHNNK